MRSVQSQNTSKGSTDTIVESGSIETLHTLIPQEDSVVGIVRRDMFRVRMKLPPPSLLNVSVIGGEW